jgi:carboxylate-amine ligase
VEGRSVSRRAGAGGSSPRAKAAITRQTHRVGVRKIGVEEEFLLVDARGTPQPLGEVVVAVARELEAEADGGGDLADGGGIEHELQLEQAEIATPPTADVGELASFVLDRRTTLAAAARERGSGLAALGTSPMPASPTPTPDARYLRMMREYGATAQEQLTCGCHVHVDIASRAEGVAVVNGIGPWLPVLAAMGANSPFWQGEDTGYASYRRMVWARWPGSGPTQAFADEAAYDAAVTAMVASGVLLDDAMVYFDARLSARYPTVEVRVADVQPETADTVLLAALVRALVDTAASPSSQGFAPPRLELLQGASWRAARSGLAGDLVDVLRAAAVPALELVERLVDHVRPALRSNGDLDAVESSLQRLVSRGTGAELQRASHRRRGRLSDVVADAVNRTVSPA